MRLNILKAVEEQWRKCLAFRRVVEVTAYEHIWRYLECILGDGACCRCLCETSILDSLRVTASLGLEVVGDDNDALAITEFDHVLRAVTRERALTSRIDIV